MTLEETNNLNQTNPDDGHPMHGEHFGTREIGDIDQIHATTQEHLFKTAEDLLPSDTTHVEVTIPHLKGVGHDTLLDKDNNIVQFPVKHDKDGKLRIIRDHKGLAALAGLGILTLATARFVSKNPNRKK